MVTPTLAQVDFSEWHQFTQNMHEVIARFPELETRALRRIGERIVDEIQAEANIPRGGRTLEPIDTMTYVSSLSSTVAAAPNPGESRLIIGHLSPVGSEADRLPWYWRVLEHGAAPNPRVPAEALIAWSLRRFGDPSIGYAVASNIRTQGIDPQPILSLFFIFDANLEVLGATGRTNQIIETELREFMRGLSRIVLTKGSRAGQSQIVRRGPSGRFQRV